MRTRIASGAGLEIRKKESTIEQEELRKGSSYFQERLGLKLNKVKGRFFFFFYLQHNTTYRLDLTEFSKCRNHVLSSVA